MSTATLESPALDYAALKQRQHAVWSSGDYAILGTTLQIMGESLCEAVDVRAGSQVLDVAAGNGNATLAAARRFAHVTSTDYVDALLERGRERAAAERLQVAFRHADAEALPFADAHFDVALSTVGVMFTPNQPQAAAELLRVVRPGGRIGLACWTPEGFIGQVLKAVGRRLPAPPAGLNSPLRWGTEAGLRELFPGQRIQATPREFMFRYESAQHWVDVFRAFYGPVHRAFAALAPDEQKGLEGELLELLARHNRAGADSLVVPGAYLEVVITRGP
ncbi:class I SAM-dependent methyltransferase [Ottowia sp.]|uniref:class I SAM-dependent methyltransferase n=1 Tax=Ottowia sp. TaxID=1898956 RepID=UPI0025E39401|nr:class I SAM-dependent methyltransferase [Ottowia sp.]